MTATQTQDPGPNVLHKTRLKVEQEIIKESELPETNVCSINNPQIPK
jgi:hypothetical protein